MYTFTHEHSYTHTCTLIYTYAQTHTHSHAHTQALTHRPDRGACLPPACPTSRHRELQHSHLQAPAAPLMNPQKADTAHCVTASLRSHREGGHDLSRLYISSARYSPHVCIAATALGRWKLLQRVQPA